MPTSTKSVRFAIAGNLAIAVTKFVAAIAGGSSAILAEGIHSLVDTGNGLLLLYGVRQSGRPPDAEHPFGHGKEAYFYSLMVAVLIFGVGGGVSIYEGLLHVLHPASIEDARLSYLTIGIAAVFEGMSWAVAAKEFRRAKGSQSFWATVRRSKDPTQFAVLFEDSAALVGLALAAGGVALSHTFGLTRADGAASMLIGAMLCVVAAVMLRETKNLLIGESADRTLREDIRALLAGDPHVAAVRRVLTMQLGPDSVLVNADLCFSNGLDAPGIGRVVKQLEQRLRDAHPDIQQIFIEASQE